MRALLHILTTGLLATVSARFVPRQEGTFTNPINQAKGADPCMRQINGTYYMTSTQNTDISMWKADTVEGLHTADKITLFTDDTEGRNFDLWAPEFWYLDGAWYIYYAAAGNFDDNTHRLHVLRGGTNESDPSIGPYEYAGTLIPDNFDAWAVDGSILELDGARYLVFSGQQTDTPWTQCLYIVEMSDPVTLVGDAQIISCPEYTWETAATPVQEGPEPITYDGTTYIVYSASHCSTVDYALGLLTLTAGADPMQASSWTKAPEPLFSKNDAAGVYGPGHHFMFQTGDEYYFAYHGKTLEDQYSCGDERTTRVQPFSFNASGPVFPVPVAVGVDVPEPPL
ncbi:glycosyl hydrolase [Schizophyllum commune]